ncbi:hypothetical protein EVAR_44869_1 [Eumeta japonica]|uniref:Uncharacterized protein n=1 Tax=Eumeta variegata TaxID=151549 RepID=A0A4C1Y4S4_EUMVA|nr:hypothetical protein EVAR_44869_1 [Eumeta japonica]
MFLVEPHIISHNIENLSVYGPAETLKLLNKGDHRIISKIAKGYETLVPLYDLPLPTRQESRVWVHKDHPTPTIVKKVRAIGKFMYAMFFRSTGLVKTAKLKGQKTVTAAWYTQHCLPEVLQTLIVRGFDAAPRQRILSYRFAHCQLFEGKKYCSLTVFALLTGPRNVLLLVVF